VRDAPLRVFDDACWCPYRLLLAHFLASWSLCVPLFYSAGGGLSSPSVLLDSIFISGHVSLPCPVWEYALHRNVMRLGATWAVHGYFPLVLNHASPSRVRSALSPAV